jgi:hypothetical protein
MLLLSVSTLAAQDNNNELFVKFKSNISNPPVAYKIAKEYLNTHNGDDPDTLYARKWVAAYEKVATQRAEEFRYPVTYLKGFSGEPGYIYFKLDKVAFEGKKGTTWELSRADIHEAKFFSLNRLPGLDERGIEVKGSKKWSFFVSNEDWVEHGDKHGRILKPDSLMQRIQLFLNTDPSSSR